MDDYQKLIDFAEHVRREAFHASSDLFGRLGVDDPTAQRIAVLGTQAATIKAQAQMKKEQEQVQDLDLSALPPLSDNPFREE